MAYNLTTQKTWDETIHDLAETFRLWNVREWTVTPMRPPARVSQWSQSDDQRRVTLRYCPDGGQEITLTMERQARAQDNVRVLYLAVEAMRLNEVRGIAEVVRSAYLQLEAPPKTRDPYEVLSVRPDAPLEDIEAMYRIKAKRAHPDAGGSKEAMQEVNDAWERVQAERARR